MRVFSNGGGKQSTAALVLSAQGRIDFPTHVFANVGDDSENPATLAYIRDYTIPYALQHNIAWVMVQRATNGNETLYARTLREEKSIGIPVRMKNGAPGHRSCTIEYKRKTIHKYLGEGTHVIGLGISLDEFHRMRSDSGFDNVTNEYPLIDLRLTRKDCEGIIREAGLPIPPKSSCWFCPYHKLSEWQALKRNDPKLFKRAVEFENTINTKREALGRDAVYLTAKGRPLSEVIGLQHDMFESDDNCDSGYCMT